MSKGELTRTKILDQAIALASRLGFEGLTLGVLAESLSLSKSGLYAHFRSKEALILAVLDRTVQKRLEHAAPYLEGQAPGIEQLQCYLRSWLDWIALPELPAGCPILGASFEFEDVPGLPRERLLDIHRLLRRKVEALLRKAMSLGHLAPDLPVAQVFFEIRAITLGFHLEMRFMQDPNARELAETALEGLLKRYSVVPQSRIKRSERES